MDATTQILHSLKAIADFKQITNQAIADQLGYKETTIARMLDARFSPSLNQVVAVADFIGAEIIVKPKTN